MTARKEQSKQENRGRTDKKPGTADRGQKGKDKTTVKDNHARTARTRNPGQELG
jgi:hypothetical protein